MRLFLLSLTALALCAAGAPSPDASNIAQRIAALEQLRASPDPRSSGRGTSPEDRGADLERIRALEAAQRDNLKRLYSLELATYLAPPCAIDLRGEP